MAAGEDREETDEDEEAEAEDGEREGKEEGTDEFGKSEAEADRAEDDERDKRGEAAEAGCKRLAEGEEERGFCWALALSDEPANSCCDSEVEEEESDEGEDDNGKCKVGEETAETELEAERDCGMAGSLDEGFGCGSAWG